MCGCQLGDHWLYLALPAVPVDAPRFGRCYNRGVVDETEPHWSRTALITIDVQRDYLSEAPYGVAGTTEVLPVLAALADAFRRADRPIVHVVRIYLADGSNADISRRSMIRSGASIVRPGTDGIHLAPQLTNDQNAPLDTDALLSGNFQQIGPDEYVMYKPRWNAFFGTNLDRWLRDRDVDTVVVAGCNFPNCPRGTLFGASERDYRAVAVADAISGWSSASETELAGIGVLTFTSTAVIDELSTLPAATTG